MPQRNADDISRASPPVKALRLLGRPALRALNAMGSVTLFMLDGLRHIFTTRRIFGRTVRQLYVIGYQSLFVILLIGLFCGMVLGLQGYYTLVRFGSVGMLGSAVSLTMVSNTFL